ncbi:AbrB family transcriptional regulator [Dongia deserti]|uniref:AbrB family transcriptional regulator n=1 Tax=Dongia deserti TaxID=2268030 RepID=UPI000E656031|nr:AbrB family transcriptional regulator [Dongia deserti]
MHAPSLTRAKLMTLAIGIPGGTLFYVLNLPLPWMLGAMAATTVAAISGVRIALMPRLRLVFVAILGIMLGSAFTPEVVQGFAIWLGSFAWLGLYVVVATAGIWLFYGRLAKYDTTTAYFAAAPGGLNEMILAGGALGGDERRISMSHATRILIAIFVLSFGYRWFGGYTPTGTGAAASSNPMNWVDWLLLGGCGVVGFGIARALRIPAYALVGPMLLSAIVHATGMTHSRPPVWLIAAAQIVVGAMVGSRFDGVAPRVVGQALLLAIFATAILLILAALFGEAVETTLGIPFSAALLAFAPGGLAEMSLIALSLDVDAAYVSSHHIVRIFIIVLAAPLVFRLFSRGR